MKRILVVRTDRVGDVLMITPMIRELRRTFPDAFIATLTNPATSDVFRHNPHVDAILVDDLRKESFWQTVTKLRRLRFTDGLLVLPTERAAYQMFFAGIRNRVTVGHKLYAVLTFMKGVSRRKYVPLRHEADYCMDLARRIGVETDRIAPELFLAGPERTHALEKMAAKGIPADAVKILVHTGSGASAPNWSEENYFRCIALVLREMQDPAVKIALTAREMSPGFIARAVSLDPHRVFNIADEITGLRDFIAVIGAADVIVTSSTGPAHIADALGARAVVLHCHRPMNCVQYWGVLNGNSINLEVPEDYCHRHCSPDQNTCAIEGGLTPEDVLAAVRRLIPDPIKTQS